jgi:hypothetical protein
MRKWSLAVIAVFVFPLTIPLCSRESNLTETGKIVFSDPKKVNTGVVSTLEDGAVYFIRSKANTGKVFDVPGSNYTEGTQIVSPLGLAILPKHLRYQMNILQIFLSVI